MTLVLSTLNQSKPRLASVIGKNRTLESLPCGAGSSVRRMAGQTSHDSLCEVRSEAILALRTSPVPQFPPALNVQGPQLQAMTPRSLPSLLPLFPSCIAHTAFDVLSSCTCHCNRPVYILNSLTPKQHHVHQCSLYSLKQLMPLVM